MNVVLTILGAVLLALTAMLPALTAPIYFRRHLKRMILGLRGVNWRDALWDESGAVVVTYTSNFTGTGGTTAPTGTQASGLKVQTAEVFFADADAQAVITHNWGSVISSPGPQSWAVYLIPYISFVKLLGGASDSSFATNFTFGLGLTNSITMNKIGVGTGSGGTYAVVLQRV